MAKRKKHRKKQHNHKKNVVKSTTSVQKRVESADKTTESKLNIEEKIEAQATQSSVMGDVRFSLLLMGVVIVVFVAIYIALQNKSISDSVYGVIKLNNISF